MNACCLSLLLALVGAEGPQPSAKVADRLQALHLGEAEKWRIYVDESRQQEAQLAREPIYGWTNPTRSGVQSGAVYVWLHDGRPAVIGSIFSHPELGQRMICHEFHALAASKLWPERGPGVETWQPKAGVDALPLMGAPPVAASAAGRLSQMRSQSKRFAAHSIDYQNERWELRLLTQPMYRYKNPKGTVVDGAIFAFVTSAGTDPEVILVLEARKKNDDLAWFYQTVRFSDSNLYVQLDGREAWNSIRDDNNQLHFNPDHTYRLIRDKTVPELPELAAPAP